MPALEHLSETAKSAYRAFLEMSESKQAHYQCLKTIEMLCESGGVPSEAQQQELKNLLLEHDKNVAAFKAAMSAVSDAEEVQALVRLMS